MKHSILIGGFAALAVVLATVFITPRHNQKKQSKSKVTRSSGPTSGWYYASDAVGECTDPECKRACYNHGFRRGAAAKCENNCYCYCSSPESPHVSVKCPVHPIRGNLT